MNDEIATIEEDEEEEMATMQEDTEYVGGTSDYNSLTNKPKINDVELTGNKTLSDLGIATELSELSQDELHRTVTDEEKTQIAGAEQCSNKVTSISSSSTDEQYPSAKCVYSLIGNINIVLENIINGGV